MLLFWSQSLRHHARRWPFVLLLVAAFLVFPFLLWSLLDLQSLPAKTPSLSFLGKPISHLWTLEALQEGLAPAPPHPLWQGSELLSQIRLLWALILWPTFGFLLLLWAAESTSHLAASWLHTDVAGWFFSAPLSRTAWASALFLSSVTVGLLLAFAFLLPAILVLYSLTGILFLQPFLGLLPLALALALIASLSLLLAFLWPLSSPPSKALVLLLLFALVLSYFFVPSVFHQIIEPMRSPKATFIYQALSWLWPPFASLALVARKAVFLPPPPASLLHGATWLVLSYLLGRYLLLRRSL